MSNKRQEDELIQSALRKLQDEYRIEFADFASDRKPKLLGWFMGRLMTQTAGKIAPAVLRCALMDAKAAWTSSLRDQR